MDATTTRAERSHRSGVLRYGVLIFFLLVISVLCLLKWGDRLLVSRETMPPHADALVVLQGSILGERARLAGAERLLHSGVADRVLVSIPKETYWGQAVKPIAQNYITSNYGSASADRSDFCETGPEVNSTEQEAMVLLKCIQAHGWHSVVVVTSDYHTRRAGIIWRNAAQRENAAIALEVYGVDSDPDFHASRWWRERLSAKTWFYECTKLLWTVTHGD
jgi:uncharacterized SAM-binding protein YcdF (DUF218 family)